MNKQLKKCLVALISGFILAGLFIASSQASVMHYTAEQKKVLGFEIAKSLRCPKSVNQNLFDSEQPIASELKGHIFRLLDEGKTKAEIIDYFTLRYGEKIRYKPELTSGTALLWFGPILLLTISLTACIIYLRRTKTAQ